MQHEDILFLRAGEVVVRADGFTTHEVLGEVGSVAHSFARTCVDLFLHTLHPDLLDEWWTKDSATCELSRMIQSVEDRVLKPVSQRGDVSLTRFSEGNYRVDVHVCVRASSEAFFPFEW